MDRGTEMTKRILPTTYQFVSHAAQLAIFINMSHDMPNDREDLDEGA